MPNSTDLKIGALAERTGTTAPTIRYYEEIGLLPRADRQAGGQRRYGVDAVPRLTFVRRCREFGFSVGQVRALLGLLEDSRRSCREARDIAQTHLDAVRAKMAELHELERMITAFVRECDVSCGGGPGSRCVPLARLTHAKPVRSASSTRRARAP